MDLKKLETISKKPLLYEPGDSIMWTDPYISRQLLEIHLDPDIDLASRNRQSIEHTVEFILSFCDRSPLEILDLGCGPGLYAERLAASGHHVTGIDFSETSIEYASDQARAKGLNIEYVCEDYLALDYEEKFDVVLMIYTDFGVLVPGDRERLLTNIRKVLKPGGLFIFDVINEKNSGQKFREHKSWTFEEKGFWRDGPYLELSSGYHFLKEKVYLQQYFIIDQAEETNTYRFWTHYFTGNEIFKIMKDNGFTDVEGFDDVLPGTDLWSGNNITFYRTKKGDPKHPGQLL